MKYKVFDLHCDTIVEIQAGADFKTGNPSGHMDIPRLREGKIGAQVFACFVSSIVPEKYAYGEAINLLELVNETCQKYESDLQKVGTIDDVRQVLDSNKIAILPAVENGHVIASDLSNLEKIRLLGAKYMTLTHSSNLSWAASSGETSGDFEGLTPFGEKVIAAMNEMGMIIDVSHVHESTFWDVIKLSRRPIIASHSNAFTICPTPRNLTDDQIRAVAEGGGMIGINFYPGFLDSIYAEKQLERCGDLFSLFDQIEIDHWQNPTQKVKAMQELGHTFEERMIGIRVKNDAIIDHMVYIINLVGDDFIGFGSDFDGLPALPADITGCDTYPDLINIMEEKGFSDETIEKICQKNFLRVLGENE